jgi:hypothetical protein
MRSGSGDRSSSLSVEWYCRRIIDRLAKVEVKSRSILFRIDSFSEQATRYRRSKLCPYNNKVPNCTKDKANDPLGVCSVYHKQSPVITCPVRFRQDWLIAENAANFFFGENTSWTSLTEVRLKDANGQSAGNIDIVLVSYDERGKVLDFGAVEVQAVYISGNVRKPFETYLNDPEGWASVNWSRLADYYPTPDYLSSSLFTRATVYAQV